MATQLFRAKEGAILIGTAITSPSSTATIYSQLTGITTISSRVKSIEFSGGEADTESVWLFGADTDGRQNAAVEEQNMTDVEFSGTLILQDNAPMGWSSSTPAAVGTTGFTRAQGDGTRTPRCILVKYIDAVTGEQLHISMNNATFIKVGDVSQDAEGHAEQEVTAKCLSKDFRQEFKSA